MVDLWRSGNSRRMNRKSCHFVVDADAVSSYEGRTSRLRTSALQCKKAVAFEMKLFIRCRE